MVEGFLSTIRKKKTDSNVRIKNALTDKQLECPRYEEPIGDDMDEVEPPPGWNELTNAEKKQILDDDMDYYWIQDKYPITAKDWCNISFIILTPIIMSISFVNFALFLLFP